MGKSKKRASESESVEVEKDSEEIVPEDVVQVKKVRLFSAKEFRQQINTDDKLHALKNFLSLCTDTTNQDCIHEYLEKGGNCLELLQLMEGNQTVPQVIILEIVHNILLKITRQNQNQSKYQTAAYEACVYLLKTHMNMINKMLNLTSSGKERRIILKLLTVIVAFSITLAKEILIHVNFHSGNLELLTKNLGGGTESVRNAFLHFLTAFLVDGHYPTISVLLEKRGLLNSIINGLQYDVADSVCLVILALKTHVLENPLVSKTVKMRTFSTPIVRDLVNLYNWKGPQGYDPKRKEKINLNVDEYDKTKVSQTVHDFLIILCTSFKFGVIFKDRTLGLGKKNLNGLMYTVLESLERPWEHSYASDLVTKICGACPDLVKTMWSNMKLFLEPRLTVKWLNCMKFAKVLLEQLHPSSVEFCVKDFNPYQFTQMVQFLVAPTPILKTLIIENFTYDLPSIKFHVLTLLVDMLKTINLYLEAASKLYSSDAMRSVKNLLNDHIARNFPNAQNILENWQQTEENYEVSEYLNVVFQVFEHYERLCPQLLDSLSVSLDLVTFLEDIRKLNSLTDNLKPELDTEKDPKPINLLQVKAIKLFLNFDSNLFTVQSDVFKIVIPLILEEYFQTRDEFSKKTLISILKNTGIFESCEFETTIWLDAIFNLKQFDVSVGEFLVDIIQNTSQNCTKYLSEISTLKSNANDTSHVTNFDEILENLCENNFSTTTRIKHNNFSPLIFGCFDYLTTVTPNKSVKIYFNSVLTNLFHIQTNVRLFLDLIISNEHLVSKQLFAYFNSWSTGDVSVMEKSKGRNDVLPILSEALLTGNAKLFLNAQKEFKESNLLALQMSVFYLSHLNTNLTESIVNSASEIVKSLLGENYTMILLNPNLLQAFNPLHLEKNDCKGFLTRFLIDIVKHLQISADIVVEDVILQPYRAKLYNALVKVLKKAKTSEKLNTVIEIFDLGYIECREILMLVSTIDSGLFVNEENVLTLVYNITVYCFNKLTDSCSKDHALKPLDAEVIVNLCVHFKNLNKIDVVDTSLFANCLNKYLSRFPHNFRDFEADVFESILQKSEYYKENSMLASNILQNRADFLSYFETNLDILCHKKGLLLPLLESAIKLNADESILRKVYDKFKPSIEKALQKPQKAGQHFEKYFESVVRLLKDFADDKFCKMYLEKIQKFESSEVFHVVFLRTIYEKHIFLEEINEKYLNNAMLTFIHLIVGLFKRKTKSDEDWGKLMKILEIVNNFLTNIPQSEKTIDFTQISENDTFRQYKIFSLKFGINSKPPLLKLLCTFSKHLTYSEEDARLLLEMTASHSEFLEVLLNDDNQCKVELLNLVLVLCGKYPKIMERNHVPIFLGAYRASMRTSDRILLKLLKLYESVPAQTNFYDFKPFLWGRAAVNHYSVRSNIDKALWRQPKTGDILDILQESWVYNTIKDYPLNIDLNCKTPIADNDVVYKHVYDLSFVLPLFSCLLATENAVQTYKFTRSGALSLTVVALGSEDKEIRMAACHVLARFYYHLESKHAGKDNLLWVRFVEAVCRGTAVIEDFKLNHFASCFLARMSLILTQPQHVMYIPLSQYLGAKSAPDLTTIPELYTLLHSSDVTYKEHRSFILDILKDGLRTEADFDVALRSMSFKLITELFVSCVSDLDAQKMIFAILKRATHLPKGSKLLCNSYALISWLHEIILNKINPLLIEDILIILSQIVRANTVDLNSLKLLFEFILDNYLDVKMSDDTILTLLKSLIILFENNVVCISEARLRNLLLFVKNDFCIYLLDFKCNSTSMDSNDSIQIATNELTRKWLNKQLF